MFLVHKDIICAKSKFFAAACSERWVEGKEKQVRLPEVDPTVFESHLSWVYSTSLNIAELTTERIDALLGANAQEVAKYLDVRMKSWMAVSTGAILT